jgi:catechol 2,3-dioxygenase-like lactoylglutathione lyase family enzyme
MLILGFHHLAIQVRDLPRSVDFYSGVLGLQELKRHHREDGTLRSVWVSLPGGGFLALERCTGEPAEEPFRRDDPGFLLLALRIDASARDEVERELESRGIVIVHRTRWTLYVRDPEGNRIGLSHYPHNPT